MKLSTAIKLAVIAVAVILFLNVTIAAWNDPFNNNDAVCLPTGRASQPTATIMKDTLVSNTMRGPAHDTHRPTATPNVVAIERRYMCCQTGCEAFARKQLDRDCMLSGGKKVEC
jgi:hypothetical protein